MKSLIEWLNESRGQRISERPYNRPYDRDEEIAQNKAHLKQGSASIKLLKNAVNFCNDLNTNFNKVKSDFIKLSEISKKYNIDVQLALSMSDELEGYSLFISDDDLMQCTDLEFYCMCDDGYTLNNQSDIKEYLKNNYAEDADATLGFGSEKNACGWPCYLDGPGSNLDWSYCFWDLVDGGYVCCLLTIDTSNCDSVIKKSIERILSGLQNKKDFDISKAAAVEYFNMSDILKNDVHTNKKSNEKDLIFLFDGCNTNNTSYNGQLKSLIKAFDKL